MTFLTQPEVINRGVSENSCYDLLKSALMESDFRPGTFCALRRVLRELCSFEACCHGMAILASGVSLV